MTVCYLDVDDEITGAIARLRAVTDGEAVLVVPPGSHIATSRINFRLLAREATERHLNVVAVSDEPAVRALAISAGLPSYDSLSAAEQALATFREQDKQLADRVGPGQAGRPPRRGQPRPPGPTAETLVLPWPLVEAPPVAGRPKSETGSSAGAAGAAAGTTALPEAVATPADRRAAEGRSLKRPRIGLAPALLTAVLVLLIAGVAFGAYLLLPTATISLVPAATPVSTEPFTVTADPSVAVSDVEAGVVPAERIEVPVRVSNVFPATGVEARETRAIGTARFRSENTLNDVPIPEGTRVSTADGVDFVTTEPATVQRASFETGPTTVNVAIRAVRPGPRGNVAAEQITRVPNSLANQLVSVRNPTATSGGERVEEITVTEADYEAARQALLAELDTALAATLADPTTTPRGLTLFADTADLGEPTADPPLAELAGTVAPNFTLAIENVAVVVAVNEDLVDDLAAARLRSTLDPPLVMVGEQVNSGRAAGDVIGQTIAYDVAPTAIAYTEPDRTGLINQVRGKTIAEAQQILSAYGMVDIEMWPEFVDRLPDQAARISLTIQPPGEAQ